MAARRQIVFVKAIDQDDPPLAVRHQRAFGDRPERRREPHRG
jgi:hypothetical protein